MVIDLWLLLPIGYGEEPSEFPSPAFAIEAIQSVLRNYDNLLAAWEKIDREF